MADAAAQPAGGAASRAAPQASADDRPLFMMRVAVEQKKLVGLGQRLRLPMSNVDLGYLVHCAIADLFGNLAPKPFHITGETGTYIPLVGYCKADKDEMVEAAQMKASPDIYESIDWENFSVKPLPKVSAWRAGRTLGFQVRACPVTLRGSKGEGRNGSEVDAFLARCTEVGQGFRLDREEVYREWLGARLAEAGAKLIAARITRFQKSELLRRDHQEVRRSHVIERPDVTFEGHLEVADPELFDKLLWRGIGGHRTFGFGMVMLKPA